jgi:hypothetical protein
MVITVTIFRLLVDVCNVCMTVEKVRWRRCRWPMFEDRRSVKKDREKVEEPRVQNRDINTCRRTIERRGERRRAARRHSARFIKPGSPVRILSQAFFQQPQLTQHIIFCSFFVELYRRPWRRLRTPLGQQWMPFFRPSTQHEDYVVSDRTCVYAHDHAINSRRSNSCHI